MKVYEITVSTTVQIDSLDDYAESKEHAIDIMWDRWDVYKNDLRITNVKVWEEDDVGYIEKEAERLAEIDLDNFEMEG